MGTFTPNIGLYIPAAGETNYSDAFAAGMMNLDSHDHSGGPNKGLPISSTGLGNHSVTFEKLASNVADITTGIGVNNATGFQYQLQMLGVLRNLFTFASTGGGTGLIAVNGSTVFGRTLQNSTDGAITWMFPDGVSNNPIPAFNIAAIAPVTVPNGGTGVTTFNAFDIICGGATATGPLQQVAGEGTIGQYLGSGGPGALPVWSSFPAPAAQNVLVAAVSYTSTQWTSMDDSPITTLQLVPAPGAGKVIVPYYAYAKLYYAGNTGGSDPFHGGSSVRLYYGNTANEIGFQFTSGTFKDGSGITPAQFYYYGANTQTSSASGTPKSQWENQSVNVGVNSSSFTGGSGNTVTVFITYSIMNI